MRRACMGRVSVVTEEVTDSPTRRREREGMCRGVRLTLALGRMKRTTRAHVLWIQALYFIERRAVILHIPLPRFK